MGRLQVRIDDHFEKRLQKAAQERGFANVGVLVRHVLDEALKNDSSVRLVEAEGRIVATLDRFAKDLRKLHTADQALYAGLDTFIRIFLTCIPDPPSDTLAAAKSQAQQRYRNYLLNVARNMNGDARAALAELADHG